MKSPSVPVLTYHGYNVHGNDYHNNDHVALRCDLDWLIKTGWTIQPLERIVEAVFGDTGDVLPPRTVAITFDDGTDLDWHDVEFGSFGWQRGLGGILADFRDQHPDQPPPHATTFVIASADARAVMTEKVLSDGHAMGDDWWAKARASGLMTIANHSWDHCHPLVVAKGSGHFFGVDSADKADLQVRRAAAFIASRSGAWPRLFAYPWGHASDFLRHEYFPNAGLEHRCIAALGTEAGFIHSDCDRWFLPRFVCGQHWQSPEELAALLA